MTTFAESRAFTDRHPFNHAEVRPTPGWSPVSPLLTAEEAARYLRLDVGRDMEKAVRSLNRLVEQKKIRPCRVGEFNRFTVWELDNFLRERTEEAG